MKTDPTSSVSGTANMPLAYEAVQTGRKLTAQNYVKTNRNESISDTLETTDREGDGRQTLDIDLNDAEPPSNETEVADRLDLSG